MKFFQDFTWKITGNEEFQNIILEKSHPYTSLCRNRHSNLIGIREKNASLAFSCTSPATETRHVNKKNREAPLPPTKQVIPGTYRLLKISCILCEVHFPGAVNERRAHMIVCISYSRALIKASENKRGYINVVSAHSNNCQNISPVYK